MTHRQVFRGFLLTTFTTFYELYNFKIPIFYSILFKTNLNLTACFYYDNMLRYFQYDYKTRFTQNRTSRDTVIINKPSFH